MSLEIEFIPGPLTSQMTRAAAISALKQHPDFRKNSAFAVEQLEGRWVAAIVHQAGPPPFGGGAPADSDDEAPGPKSEGPDDTAPDAGPPDDGGGDEGPPSDDGGDSGPPKEKGKGGESHELKMIADMLTQVMQALGLPMGMGDSMVPGMDGGAAPPGPPMGGPPPGPPGAGGPPPPHGGPPGGPPGGGPPGMPKMMQHQRALKPGETPPGGTPVGAPAFASVNPEHPWAHMVGKYASFKVADKIKDRAITEVEAELQQLASTSGYRVARFSEGRDNDGDRVAMATISVH